MYIKSKIWFFLKYLSSLRFSISILLILALASILGTIIKQDQPLDYYKVNYPELDTNFFVLTWKHIVFFDLDHVYSAIWFLFVLLLFFASLLLCTFSTQLPIFKNSRRWSFLNSQEALMKKSCYHSMDYPSISNFIYMLSQNNYYIFHRGQVVYAHKGLAGRVAPIFVHCSIIITLLGSLLGLTYGFVAQEMVPSGEIFRVQNFTKSGSLSFISSNIIGRVDDFFVTFNGNKSIRQFFSSISLIDIMDKKVLLNKTMLVNAPLRLNGFTFYQTDWKINALRLKIGASNLMVKSLAKNRASNNANFSFWSCSLALDDEYSISVIVPDSSDDKLLIYNSRGDLVCVAHYGVWSVIYGTPIVFKDLISSTGLQVKADPGMYLAYAGFLILIISILMSYTSYSQVWTSKSMEKIQFSGNTNRALLIFENEMVSINRRCLDLWLM